MAKFLPECLMIGAAKSGTTSLAFYLSQHSDVLLAKDKEAHFFDSDERYSRGLRYYRDKFFLKNEENKVWIDATPEYLHSFGKTIPRILEAYGEATPKFIVVMRDPVKRSLSHYKHRVRNGKESLDFINAIGVEKERIEQNPSEWWRYRQDSLYGRQLNAWFRSFGRQNFLLIKHEDLLKDPLGVVNQALEFIGIYQPIEHLDLEQKNPASIPKFSWLNTLLNARFPLPAVLKRKVFGEAGHRLRRRLRRMNQKPLKSEVDKEILNSNWMSEFRASFHTDLELLEQITGCSFDEWK